jgi:cytidylate kinase
VSVRAVCISRERGADGEGVGRAVAERLSLQYVDEEVIARAAERAGVDADVVSDTEARKSRLRRVIDFLSDAGTSATMDVEPSVVRDSREASYRSMIRAVVEEIGRDGEVVIVAHAASMALGAEDGVLRVLVAGSPERRAERIRREDGLDEAEAAKVVRDSDHDRASYLKTFYGVERESPAHYDLVVNTDRLDVERAADVVVRAAEQLGR